MASCKDGQASDTSQSLKYINPIFHDGIAHVVVDIEYLGGVSNDCAISMHFYGAPPKKFIEDFGPRKWGVKQTFKIEKSGKSTFGLAFRTIKATKQVASKKWDWCEATLIHIQRMNIFNSHPLLSSLPGKAFLALEEDRDNL